jgi:hypothetical protein
MNCRLLNIKTVAFIALVGLLATWWIRHSAEAQFRLNEEILGNQQRQIAKSPSMHAFTSNSIVEPNNLSRELEQLRDEREKLQVAISNLQAALEQPPRWGRSSLTHYPRRTRSPEEWALTDVIAAGKKQDIQTLSQALNRYAADHQGQFPSSIDQIDAYLRQDNLSLTGTNQFDIVYNGTVDGLTNFPLRSVAMIRERQPWLAPDGRWTRVYGMYGGSSKIISSDDNFSAFESEYIVSSLASNPIAQ